MQFHLNGFQAGNPHIAKKSQEHTNTSTKLPNKLDVLIVGSGPAGLTLAAQLANHPSICTRIIEQKPAPMQLGQADGVSCRSMEMFQAFGFSEQVAKEAYWVNETTFWGPDTSNQNHIVRNGRVQDVADGLSHMPHVILNQARIHDMYLEKMRHSPTRLEVDYGYRLVDLSVDKSKEYPVEATIERLDEKYKGQLQTICARYVVGCDGAASKVRTAIGRKLTGDYQNQAWGVMDVLVHTDFPDIRLKSIIKSAHAGNILIIPREGGYLVRLYVELDKIAQKGDSRDISIERLIQTAQDIFKPYFLDVKEVAWWSVYEVGHSVCDKFDDVQEGSDAFPNVFIAGDACHTHSAKAGQGMNVSMGDTFNLGWKLASVLLDKCDPSLLRTYSNERQAVAQALIDYDHKWARVMSAPVEKTDSSTVPLVQQHFVQGGEFTAGMSVKYEVSTLTKEPAWQKLAKGFVVGTRLHSTPVVRLGDAKVTQLLETIQVGTRWYLYIFADNKPLCEDSKLYKLCDFLEKSPSSPIAKHTLQNSDIDESISVCGVFQQAHAQLDFSQMPSLLRPLKGKHQITDYEKMYCPDLRTGNDIFTMREIDRNEGCVLIVRPDQYIAHILPLDAHNEIADFFAPILKTN